MRLSGLQKSILNRCYSKNNAGTNADFYGFCLKEKTNKKVVQDIVHKSLESLVEKDLLVAFGKKTAKKWFIEKVRLTREGRALVKKIIEQRQGKLPLNK